jgi:hypothetical protein
MSLESKHVFKLSYDSTSTDDHTIDAEVLGKSLLNMSGLIKESTKVLNGEESLARVEVQAHEPGSFVVEFVAWLHDGGADVLGSLGIFSTAASVAAGNVFAALKALRNRKQVEKHIRDGNVDILFEDGESLTIPENVDKLISNHSVRTKIEEVVKKASDFEDGATVKFLNENDELMEEIEPQEVEFFKAPPRKLLAEEITTTEATNVVFTVVALESKNGWKIRLASGDEVSAVMNDKGFIERINNREREFIKGDMFEIELKTVERTLDGKVTTKRSIERVIRHRVDPTRKVL